MLRSISELKHFAIRASDGNIGHVQDFYFDDHAWTIRYFVVDTGDWLPGRKILISPISVGDADWLKRELPVTISKQQVLRSPGIDTEQPVSRQYETQYLDYYNYPFYWGGAGVWGGFGLPGSLLSASGFDGADAEYDKMRIDHAHDEVIAQGHDDRHLRSYKSVMGYHIHAIDGDIGHVQGMLVDEASWTVRYLIVDTSNWWMGHQVLIAVHLILRVSWPGSDISVRMSRQAVREALPYDAAEPAVGQHPSVALSQERQHADTAA